MKILVINGSPKGADSITLQSVLYLEKLHKDHEFRYLHVGQKIKALEHDFSKAEEELLWADVLLFSYPVYTFIAPYQMHRFIELMKVHNVDVAGKYATQISTSKHFYDVTAHRYIEDNCYDLNLQYVEGISCDMEDLLKEEGRRQLQDFYKRFCHAVEKGYFKTAPKLHSDYIQGTVTKAETPAEKKPADIVIVTDCKEDDIQLQSMIDRFQAKLPLESRIVNLWDYPFSGGCLGCFNCAVDGTCIYRDGFDEFLRTKINSAQAVIYAFTISDHNASSRFKLFYDRQFCNGHRTMTVGMPMGYLISGDLSVEENLRTIIHGRAQVGQNPICGTAYDDKDVDAQIDRMCEQLVFLLENKITQPQNFYGIGGMTIFRDLIFQMQGMMRADHKFYKKHGIYDTFPQRHKGKILAMYLAGMLMNPKIKKKLGGKMTEGMLMPYKKILDNM